MTCLWEADPATGAERLVADPRALGADEENLPPQERARRERVRETAAGIVAYATDRDATLAVFALSGQVYAVPLGRPRPGGAPRLLPTRTPALDPRPNPPGPARLRPRRRAAGHDLATGAGHGGRAGGGVTFGLAEFVAAEEMGRSRGYWWSPDGSRLLVARVDESPVARWHIADPANPDQAPAEVGLPRRGHRQRGRVAGGRDPARRPRPGRPQAGRDRRRAGRRCRLGPGRLPLPGQRGLGRATC